MIIMEENNKYLIIYHKEDNDGLFSCAITMNYIHQEMHVNKNDIEVYGASYNDLNQLVDYFDTWKSIYKSIVMVDISFKAPDMKRLYNLFGNDFIWIDHHKPIIIESFKHGFDSCPGVRQTDRSALALAYKFFYDPLDEKFQNKTMSKLFHILSSYDSWTYEQQGYELDYVATINKYIAYFYKLDLDRICLLCHDILYKDKIVEGFEDEDDLINHSFVYGKDLLDYDKYNYSNLIQNSADFDWVVEYPKDETHNRHACALFIQGPTSSIIFNSCPNEIDNGIVFKRNPDTTWTISLYNVNDDEFHCGDYLKKKYKGGGHKGAAGCVVSEKKFLKILKNKRI